MVHMQSGELVAATGMLVRVWASLVNTEREYTQRQRLGRAQWAHALLICFLSLSLSDSRHSNCAGQVWVRGTPAAGHPHTPYHWRAAIHGGCSVEYGGKPP